MERKNKYLLYILHTVKKVDGEKQSKKRTTRRIEFCGVLALKKLKTMDSIDNFAIFNFKWKLWTVISHFME